MYATGIISRLNDDTITGNQNGIYLLNVSTSALTALAPLSLNDTMAGMSPFQRSVFSGNYIYGLSRCRIASALSSDPSGIVDDLQLVTAASCTDPLF